MTAAPLSARHNQLVRAACERLERDDAVDLATLAADANLSPWHFQRLFKSQTGLTPKQYASARRHQSIQGALKQHARVSDGILEAGFGNPSGFYEQGAKRLGMSPTSFKQGGKDVEIRFGIAQCTLGALLVARTDIGICDIRMGDDAETLVHAFQDVFPNAVLLGGDEAFDTWIAKIVGLIEEPSAALDLPLDIRGTAFQERVWRALMQIPPGTTATYAEIAERIGRPSSVRAVANACGANKIAVAIPCHRVVRSDGSLSGYRWGVDRKRALLLKEAALSAS
jgi:AraC family transcriptional regulator of adaptative response/methylated-DNA-[protein]-cysteine methyltransferase